MIELTINKTDLKMKIEGKVVAKKGTKVCLIASRFNEFIVSKLV